MSEQSRGIVISTRKPPTDLANLWINAIEQYNSHISDQKGLKKIEHDWSNMVMSLQDVENEVRDNAKSFLHKRHSGSKGDGLRASVRKNLGIAQFIGDQVAKAVSTSFPAASPIWTAATFAIQIAQKVSADYDKVQEMFVEMGDFLKTVKILEDRVPDNASFAQRLTDTMESLLVVFAVHTKYMKQGRALKFLSSIFGDDDELEEAYANVRKALDKLTSATSTMALRNTQDIKNFLADNRDQVEQMEKQLTIRMDQLNDKSDLILRRQMTFQNTIQDSFRSQRESQQRLEKMLEDKFPEKKIPGLSSQANEQTKAQGKDPAVRKPAAFNQIKAWCSAHIEGHAKNPMQFVRKFGRRYVDTKYSWFFQNEPYISWSACRSDRSMLLLRGPPGVGKSALSQFVSSRLDDACRVRSDRSFSARFHFQETEEGSQSIRNCLLCLSLQLSQKDSVYCEQIASQLLDGNRLYDNPEDIEVLWEELFRKKFGQQTEDSVFLILDGLDELPKLESEKLFRLLGSITKDKLKIRVLLTSRPAVAAVDTLDPMELEMSRSVLKKDMSALASERCNSLPRISRFPKRTRQIIRAKVVEKADGMLYIDLALHHLESIGRESLARKALNELPSSLPDLFKHTVSEPYHSRPPKAQQAIRTLYTWLIYAKRPLSIAEANQLVSISTSGSAFKVEDEVQGQSSRLLGLVHEDDDDSDDGEVNEPLHEDSSSDGHQEEDDDSISGSLYFQEKAFRDFLKEQESHVGGLAEPQNAAHIMIFEASIRLLCSEVESEIGAESGNGGKADSKENNQLLDYASRYWDLHFLQISVNDVAEEQVCRVISLLSQVFQNIGNPLAKIEESRRAFELSGKFVPCPIITKSAFESIPAWLERAEKVVSMLEPNVIRWLRRSQSDPKTCLQDLLRSHGQNWYKANSNHSAYWAFMMAVQVLYLLENASGNTPSDDLLSPERIRQVIDTFGLTVDDFKFHRALAAIYRMEQHHQLAAEECENALTFDSSNNDRFRALHLRATCGLTVRETDTEGRSTKHLEQAHSFIVEAFTMIDSTFAKPYSSEDRDFLFDCWFTRAEIEAKLDLCEEAVRSFDESASLLPWTQAYILDEIFSILEEQKDWKGIITRLGETKTEYQRIFLAQNISDGTRRIQRAAKEVGEEGISTVTRLYNQAIEYYDRNKRSGAIRLRLAYFYRNVIRDSLAAKDVLIELLDSDACKTFRGDGDDMFSLVYARFYYAEILYEDFVSSHQPSHKAALLTELKNLPEKQLGKSLALDFEQSSNTAIMLARMLRKLGTAQDYYDTMQSTFDICYRGLTDATSNNDEASLRLFAKLLALVGLQRDAEIAYSAQFYKLDGGEDSKDLSKIQDAVNDAFLPTDSRNQPLTDAEPATSGEPRHSSSTAQSTPEPKSGTTDIDVSDELLTPNAASDPSINSDIPSKDTASPNFKANSKLSLYGDLNHSTYYCDNCEIGFTNWSSPFYLCAICASCDLCEVCYEKRKAMDKGEPNDSWREYCGVNHTYIKGPVEGWRGIKTGVMRIERVKLKDRKTEGERGEDIEEGKSELEEIKFVEWLKELKERRWVEVWEKWWLG
ncbi:MAG: hypothetical protein M1820_005377 [Bogoriella megaspora]|nr:MAG: hypothetical protein M1820_005377 [Bogoriella megaspora]